MQVKILKTCFHETLGALKKGQEVDVDETIAKIWADQKGCEILSKVVEEPIETKVIHNKPRKG